MLPSVDGPCGGEAETHGAEGGGQDDDEPHGLSVPVDSGDRRPREADGEESFDLLVCTPMWLAREVADAGPQVGRHRLIIATWNAANVEEVVTHLFERESRTTGSASDYGESQPRTRRR